MSSSSRGQSTFSGHTRNKSLADELEEEEEEATELSEEEEEGEEEEVEGEEEEEEGEQEEEEGEELEEESGDEADEDEKKAVTAAAAVAAAVSLPSPVANPFEDEPYGDGNNAGYEDEEQAENEEGDEQQRQQEAGSTASTVSGAPAPAAVDELHDDGAVISLHSTPNRPMPSSTSATALSSPAVMPAPVEAGQWAEATLSADAAEGPQVRSPSSRGGKKGEAGSGATSPRSPRTRQQQEQAAVHEDEGGGEDEEEGEEESHDSMVGGAAAVAAALSAAGSDSGAQAAGETQETEEEQDEEAEEQDDEEEEEEEEEPILKYQRLGADVSRLLHSTPNQAPQDTARTLLPHSKFLLLATSSGSLHMLDPAGNEISHWQPHTSAINDLSLDSTGEYLASSSADGSVCITNLYTKELQRHAVGANVLSVALPAHYKANMMFASGGSDGRLVVNKKGWFSANNIVIHSGEGGVASVRWRRELIAWSNSMGVKVYDVNTSERITHIKFDTADQPQQPPPAAVKSDKRAAKSAAGKLVSASLCWSKDDELMIAYGRQVKIGKVKERAITKAERQAHPDRTTVRYVQIVSLFTVDYAICGIAPYENDVLLLALPDAEDGDDEVQRPELRIVTRSGDEVRVDVLPVHGYEICTVKDYHLAYHVDDGGLPCFYIVSPHDILAARPRDADDHISYLYSLERYHDALMFVQSTPPPVVHQHSRQAVVAAYLDHLFALHSYDQCAQECSKLLGLNQQLWEEWIARFKRAKRLGAMVQYVPTFNPQLTDGVYEQILLYFLDEHNREDMRPVKQHNEPDNDEEEEEEQQEEEAEEREKPRLSADESYAVNLQVLLKLITSWNKHIYDTNKIIAVIKQKLSQHTAPTSTPPQPANTPATSPAPPSPHPLLLESLAELYLINKQYHLALSVYLGLRRHDVFSLIRDLQLFHVVQDKLCQLFAFDSRQAVRLAVEQHSSGGVWSVDGVMAQLRSSSGKREWQYEYLHELNRYYDYSISDMSAHYADLLLQLYSDYKPAELINYLRSSSAYNVDTALTLCERQGYYKELIHLYRQMGNSQLALTIILHKLHNIAMAIQFVEEAADEQLWDELIAFSLHDSQMLAQLLMYAGDHNVDLVKLVQRVPADMEIVGLKSKLQGIMRDCALQVEVLKAGVRVMDGDIERELDERRRREGRAVLVDHCHICSERLAGAGGAGGAGGGKVRRQRRPRRKRGEVIVFDESRDGGGRGDGRDKDDGVIVFFCGHTYHKHCLVRAMRERQQHGGSDAQRAAGKLLLCVRCEDGKLGGRRRLEDKRMVEEVKEYEEPSLQQRAHERIMPAQLIAPAADRPAIVTAQPVAQPAVPRSKAAVVNKRVDKR